MSNMSLEKFQFQCVSQTPQKTSTTKSNTVVTTATNYKKFNTGIGNSSFLLLLFIIFVIHTF